MPLVLWSHSIRASMPLWVKMILERQQLLMQYDASLQTSKVHLKAIMESLSLNASEIRPGLGELNLLFIAAELILLKEQDEGGIKLALIEELEAHLHPQAQLRLINYLQAEYNENGAQIIISTHSPILASKINLKNLILGSAEKARFR